MKTYDRFTLALAAGAALGAMLLASPDANAQPIQEDDPGWNCITMGDWICGPGNSNGVTPGCYNDQQQLVAQWPCHVVVDPRTGEGDVYAGPDPTRPSFPVISNPVEMLLGTPPVPVCSPTTLEQLMLGGGC